MRIFNDNLGFKSYRFE